MVKVGRAVVTKGHGGRRLGRTIRKIEASVELSSKESRAKVQEHEYKAKAHQSRADEGSPVQNLRSLAARNRDSSS